MSVRRIFIVLLVAFAFAQAEASAADWTRLRSANFTFEGDVGEKELRAVARRLEQFREVVGRQLPSAKLVTPAPVTVFVFAHRQDFKTVSPLYDGKPVEVAGYATLSPYGASIAICADNEDRAYPIIYHEYGHLLISNAIRNLPLWLQEGLAEYYRTFKLSNDGRHAVLGSPPTQGEIDLLRGKLLPMAELMAADEASALYNVGQNRSRFYLQSWALVHYLLLGNRDRTPEFSRFIDRIAAGTPADKAFAEAFSHSSTLAGELSNYVEHFTFNALEVTVPGRVAGASEYEVSRMTPAESLAGIGRLLAQQHRFAEAEARFAQAIALAPATSSAHTGVGYVRLLQNRPLDAMEPLRKGAELDARGAMAHFLLGLAALRCSAPGCEQAQGGAGAAREALARAVDLEPRFPEALANLGSAEMAIGADLASAERHAAEAVALLPGRIDYRLRLAQVYLRREEFPKAQDLLGPIAAAAPDAVQKAVARQLLGQVADRMRIAALRATQPSAPAPDATPRPSGTPPGEAPVQPDYRRIGDGEHRAPGTLASILCAPKEVVVVIQDGAIPRRFSAPSLADIDFITHRDDLKGSVSCGLQAAAPSVYLTWRAPRPGEPALGAHVEGRVVAIEFLPVK